ncbi:MAG TPA: hypothetical protein VLC08_13510 [Chitinolyticbacter sp.]|nr:hypothetical protein [Chitinolyticbacter sp.]
MHERWWAAALAAVMISACASPVETGPALIVKFRDDGRRESVLAEQASLHGVTLGQGRPLSLGAWLYPVTGRGRDALLADLVKSPEVDYAEWDSLVTTQ